MIRMETEGAAECRRCKRERDIVYTTLGLCRPCYVRVRELTKREAHTQHREATLVTVGTDDWNHPERPTKYPPGSEGKMRVLTERATLGLPVFNCNDLGADGLPLHTKGF